MIDYIKDLYDKPRYQLTTKEEWIMALIDIGVSLLILGIVVLITFIQVKREEKRKKYW